MSSRITSTRGGLAVLVAAGVAVVVTMMAVAPDHARSSSTMVRHVVALPAGRVVALPAPLAILHPRPAGRLIASPRDLAVPILKYHSLGEPLRLNSRLCVTGPAFVAQLRYLLDHDYRAVTLQRLYDFWHGRGTLPAHPIVLEFDDGYRGDFTIAAPLLASLHWPGVLNLIAAPRDPRWGMGAEALPAPLVRTLLRYGWEIDSHTLNHPDLRRLAHARLVREVLGSRERLRSLFHVPVNFFSYPFGYHNARVIAEVRAAGYCGADDGGHGFAVPSEIWTLPRIAVVRGETLRTFAWSLRTGL